MKRTSPRNASAPQSYSIGKLLDLSGASNFLIQLIDKRKAEILQLVQDEVHRLFDRIDVPRLIRACVAENDIELRIRFHPRKK